MSKMKGNKYWGERENSREQSCHPVGYKPTGPCGSWLILEKYFYSAFLHRTVEKRKRCLRLAGFFSKLNPLAFGISLVKHNWCWTHLFARAKPHVHKCKLAEPDIPTSSTSVKGSLQVWNGCWKQLWGFVCAVKGRLIMCVTTERLLVHCMYNQAHLRLFAYWGPHFSCI